MHYHSATVNLRIEFFVFFFFNDSATTEIYTILFVGSVRWVEETDGTRSKEMAARKAALASETSDDECEPR